ncbi:MAG: MerR family DNA-binding transcriptional regulator [Planctomycetota bacterium]
MYLKAHEVAELAGISKNTLLRWLKAGKVPEVARDRNGWRVFSEEDVARVRAYAGKITPPEVYAQRIAGPGASSPDVGPARCAGPDANGEAA